MTYANFVTTFDGVDLTGIAATLAGLSIASAAFLLGAVKDRSERLLDIEDLLTKASKLKGAEGALSALGQQANAALEGVNNEQRLLKGDTTAATKLLVTSFWYFVACLSWGFTLDPVIDQKFLSDAACGVANCYAKVGTVDVVATYVLFSAGLAYLVRGANSIRGVIGDTTPDSDDSHP